MPSLPTGVVAKAVTGSTNTPAIHPGDALAPGANAKMAWVTPSLYPLLRQSVPVALANYGSLLNYSTNPTLDERLLASVPGGEAAAVLHHLTLESSSQV